MAPHQRDITPKPTAGVEEARRQVDRILASDTLRTSEVLRRLLKFLADKTFSGEADHLKEYSVGLDALGKPSSYDPRRDAAVRLQASRLRLKLDQYYRTEGKDDPLVIEMPRGTFKISWQLTGGDEVSRDDASSTPPLSLGMELGADGWTLKKWRTAAVSLALISFIFGLVTVWALVGKSRMSTRGSKIPPASPELDALWSPFLFSAHHLIIAFSNPLFIRFQRPGSPDVVYRKKGMTDWGDSVSSPEFALFSRSLGKPSAKPSFNFVERSDLDSIFVLSQFLGHRRSDISLTRLDDLSWQQFADNDVVLLATPTRTNERQSALPVEPAFIFEQAGIRNLHPLHTEPPLYEDADDHQESDGAGLELVSVLPGPLGRTTVMSFAGEHTWGMIGCVEALTDPTFARVVAQELRGHSGQLPRYYQIVIRVGYRDGTATNASYVTHRVLSMAQNVSDASH